MQHCALTVVRRSRKFSPRRRPLPRGTGRPKFNQLKMVTTFTYKPSFSEDRCTQFRVIVVTDPPTQTHPCTDPQTGPITIHCATASVQCILPKIAAKTQRQLIVVDYIRIAGDLVRRRRDTVVKAWDLQPTKSGMAYVGNAITDVFCVSVCPCSKSTAIQSPASSPAVIKESLMTAGRAKLLPSTKKVPV